MLQPKEGSSTDYRQDQQQGGRDQGEARGTTKRQRAPEPNEKQGQRSQRLGSEVNKEGKPDRLPATDTAKQGGRQNVTAREKDITTVVKGLLPDEVQMDMGMPSQQSGLSGDSWLPSSIQEGVQIIPLRLQCAKPYFSAEEKEYFTAAALGGRVSQTHYTNPDSDAGYRCQLCAKILNPVGLAKHTTRHSLRMHNTPNGEYLVTLHGDPQKQISIKTGGVTARRSGADPPPLAMIQEYGSRAMIEQENKSVT